MLKWFSFMAEPCFGHWHYFSMRCASLSSFHVDLFSSLDETKRCYDLVTKKFYRTEEIWTRGEFACAACVCKRNGQLKCWDMKCKVPRCQATARVEGRCCRFCFENSTVKGLWRILIKNRIEAEFWIDPTSSHTFNDFVFFFLTIFSVQVSWQDVLQKRNNCAGRSSFRLVGIIWQQLSRSLLNYAPR